jgi:hypothetical protein
MIQYLWTFERHVAGMHPLLLLVMSLLAILSGIFVWLRGIGFIKAMFIVIGVFCGLVVSVFISGSNWMLIVALVGAGALLAFKLQDVFLTLAVSALAAVVGSSILISPYVDMSNEPIVFIRQLAIGVPYYNWPMLLLLIVVPLAAGTAWWHETSAVLCSATGTSMLLAGAILMMVRSGFGAVAHISGKRQLYIAVFIAVTVIGALVQLLLMPRVSTRVAAARETAKLKAKRAKKRKHGGGDDESPSSKTAWRTA